MDLTSNKAVTYVAGLTATLLILVADAAEKKLHRKNAVWDVMMAFIISLILFFLNVNVQALMAYSIGVFVLTVIGVVFAFQVLLKLKR